MMQAKRIRDNRVKLVLAAAVAGLVGGRTAHATDIMWNSAATSTSWNAVGNWVGGAAPVNDTTTDRAVFDSLSYAFSPTLDASTQQSISGLVFGDGSTASAALTLGTTSTAGANQKTSGTTTAGSSTVTVVNATGLMVGEELTGTGIPAGTRITNIAGNVITLSQVTTATINSATQLTFKPTLTIGSSGILVNAGVAGIQAISAPVVLGASQSWTNNSTLANALTVSGNVYLGANTLTYNGAASTSSTISGVIGGTGGLSLASSGALLLSGANTYSGGTALTSGALTLGIASTITGGVIVSGPVGTGLFHLGTAANSVTLQSNVTNGTTRTISTGISLDGDVVFASTAASGRIALNVMGITGGNQLTNANTITLTKSVTLSNSGGVTVDLVGAITGSGFGITKLGSSTLNLGNSSTPESIANTYTGLTTISGGIVALNKAAGVDAIAGNILIDTAGTLNLGANNENINDASSVTVNTGGVFGLNARTETIGSLTVGGGTVSTGTGTVIIAGSGAVSVTAGTISAALTLGTGGLSITNSGTAAATISGAVGSTGTANITVTNAGSGVVTLGTAAINNQGTITNNGGGTATTTISGAIGTAVTGVTQNSSTSAMVLSGNNTFISGVTLAAGTLKLSSTTALGATASTLTISGGSILDSGVANLVIANGNAININGDFSFLGTQNLDLGSGAVTLAGPLTLTTTAKTLTIDGLISGGNGIFDITKAGAGTFDYTQNIALSGTQVIDKINAGIEQFGGVLSGSGANLTLNSLGTLLLSNSNTYSGTTLLKAGTLKISGASGSVATPVIVNPGTTLAFDSSTTGVAGATRASSVTLKGGSLTVTGNVNGVGNVNSVDTITGTLTIDNLSASGTANTVTLTGGTATNWQLTAGSLVRANDGVVLFRGTGLGTGTVGGTPTVNTSNISFTTAPTAALVGGTGTAGSQNIAILPWAIGDTSAAGTGSSFVTYDANGIRPLSAGEYDTSLPAVASTDNVSLAIPTTTTTTFNGDTTVNSLLLTTSGAGVAGILAGTGKVTVTSGAVFAAAGSTGLTISKQLDFGSARGIIGIGSISNVFNINGGISGTGGVTFYSSITSGIGDQGILLNGANGATTYSGDTIILGNLKVSTTTGVAILPNGARTGDVYIYGSLTLNANVNGSGSSLQINGLNGSGVMSNNHSNAVTLIFGDNNAGGNFSGSILSGNGNFTLTKIGTGTETFSGTGSTVANSAVNVQNGILSVVTLNSVVGGVASSSLGHPGIGSATISLGSTTTTGQLSVVGTGETTDRVINLAGTTGGGTLDQSGTGALKFTSDFTATGNGAKTLTLQGSTAGTGEIAGAIVDHTLTTVKTSVAKAGTGTWKLSGANTYTGTTSVAGGTLVIASTLGTGNVSVTGGTLELDSGILNPNEIADTATLSLSTGGSVFLNFSTTNATESIASLNLNGISQAAGTYGATGSGATFTNDSFFSGGGTLTVMTPEPASVSLIGFGAMGLLARRRRNSGTR